MSRGVVVTLLTDFGESDGYAGALKGSVLSVCPDAQLVDLTHAIAPGDVAAGARALSQAAPYYPAGSVHVAVVDPGVGSARRALAAELDTQRYVAPDNGLLTGVLEAAEAARVVELTRPELWRAPPSPVFHGRDIFGPIAGHLAAGKRLDEVGAPVDTDSLVRLQEPPPRSSEAALAGEVVAVDHFGNLVTNLRVGPEHLTYQVEVADRTLPLSRTYSDVDESQLVALIGSTGRVEIACNRGRADRLLGEGQGLVVVLRAPSGGRK